VKLLKLFRELRILVMRLEKRVENIITELTVLYHGGWK